MSQLWRLMLSIYRRGRKAVKISLSVCFRAARADLFWFGLGGGVRELLELRGVVVVYLCDISFKAFSIFFGLFTSLCFLNFPFSCNALWFVLP